MIRFAKNILSAGLGGLALVLLALPTPAAQPVAVPANLPLYFEAGQGQANVPSQFIVRGHDYQFLILPTEAQIALRKAAAESAVVRIQFIGASAQAQIRGDAALPGKVNYLTGNDPAQWRTGVAMFAKVRVGQLYPGVNLVYYGNQQQLEYDFDVAPGTDPDVIAIHFDGVDKILVNPEGELILSLAGGEIHQPKPVIYQVIGGIRKEIAGGYRLVDTHTVAFVVGQYDRSQTLIIDPVLGFSTYFGGTAGDTAWAVALDTNGLIYVTGQTFSPEFYTNGWSLGPAFSTYGAFQTNYNGGKLTGDAFVAKLGNGGNTVYYLTYLGGSADDGAFSVAVDAVGDAYVTGFTDSTNFPTSTNALYKKISGSLSSIGYYPIDAFVTELSPDGSSLVYSTYLGGSGADSGISIAVDSSNNTYVTGITYSSDFPVTNAIQKHLACTNSFVNANAFIAKIGPGGSPLVYSTYFGGNNFDEGRGIAVDTNGFVYVTGFTASTNFPTKNAFQTRLNNSDKITSASDAFVAKFDSTGTNLIYSTLLGSTNNDAATGIAVDNNGAAYVTGWTVSTNFPNTVTNIAALHSFVVTNTSRSVLATNVFLTKIITTNSLTITNNLTITNTQAVIAWSTVFGGKGLDVGNAVAVDPAGDVFVTGSATSTNFPTFNVPGLMSATNSDKRDSGKSDAFVIAFTNNATALLYSGYLGGKGNDFGYGIAVDANGNAFVVGQTLSTNFPTFNAPQTSRNGTNDAFVTEIILTVPPPEIYTNAEPISQTNAVGSTVTFFINGAALPPYFLQWQKDGTNLVNGTNLVYGEIISGATNVTLTISNAQTNDDGNYSVILTNYGGSVTSSNAFLLVTNVPPAITVPPINQTNGVGTTVTLAVTATGTAPLSYQWQVNGTNLVNGGRISGATTNMLTISNVQLTNSGNYTIIVTNLAGSATTNAVLTVLASPVITVQPTNQAIAVGSTATFTVIAIGTVPLRYQWWDGTNLVKNGTVINGATISGAATDVLTISNVQTTNSGNYMVIVTNVSGSVTSAVAVLTVTNIPPTITGQPASQTNGVGSVATFVVSVSTNSTPLLSYQWQVNGTNLVNGHTNGATISGATSNVLAISNVQLTNGGSYTVIVTNFGGSVTSSVAILTVLSSPMITVQPTNQAIAVGSNATFTVTAIGTVPLSYQWWDGTNLVKNGGHFSGATTTNLTIVNAQTTNSGSYTVIVTNIAGSVTSSVAALTVTNIPPAIKVQPTNQTVVAGSNVKIAVTATGTAPLRYQWQKEDTNLVSGWTNLVNGSRISGATNNVLTISTSQTNDTGNYQLIVTNYGGSVTSSAAFLLVAASPVITVQPTNQAIVVGATTTFAVTAIGTVPLHFQWLVNGTNLANGDGISNATTRVLTISNAQTNNSGSYTVIITNSVGSVTSSVAVLTVALSPAITAQPTNQTVVVGTTATFAVTATGTAPLSYQWQINGTNLVDGTNLVNGDITSGATTNELTISNAQTNNSGSYTVIVTNIVGSVTSSNAVLTVASPPTITQQPSNQTVVVGSTVSFSIDGEATPPFFFQWLKDGTNLVDGGRISGATNVQLIISNVQTSDSGSYWVTVTNIAGSATSSNAVLTVILPPSFGNILAAGDSFILSGTGGVSNGTYYVLISSNLLTPLGQWTYLATNQFDSQGDFIFTNTAQTNAPQLFYLLQLP